MNHQVYHSDLDHAFTALRQGLVVLGQSAVLAEPREGALHDPAFGENDKAMGRLAFHDLDRSKKPTAGPVYELARIATVRKDQLQSAKPRTQLPDQELGPVAVLDIRGMHHQRHDQPQRVDNQMTLAAQDFLARVVSPSPPFSAVLTDWLSRMPTLGVGFFPAFRRTRARSRS